MPQDTLTQTPNHPNDDETDSLGRKPSDPDFGNELVGIAGDAGNIGEVAQHSREQYVEPTLEEVGNQAQEMSDAQAGDRMAHAVNQRVAESAPLFEGAKQARKTAAEFGRDATLTAVGLTLFGQAAAHGIDGFLDNQDQKHEEWQQQQQEWDQQQRQDGVQVDLDNNKATIDLDKIDKKE